LVKETGVHGENHRPAAGHWQTLSHNDNPNPLKNVNNQIIAENMLLWRYNMPY
jgi:hypothetical protein